MLRPTVVELFGEAEARPEVGEVQEPRPRVDTTDLKFSAPQVVESQDPMDIARQQCLG